MSKFDVEEFEVGESEEDLAYILTIIASQLNPKIHLGKSYELFLTLLVEILNGYEITEDDGIRYGLRILDTVGSKDDGILH